MTTFVDLPVATDLSDIAERLLARLRSLDSVAVAFSGGVDSTLVLAAAVRVLPANRVLAVIADSPSLARTELIAARQVAADLGAELVEVRVAELDVPGYRANAGDRCYFCKHTVLSAVSELAVQRGIAHVATGTHADDRRALHRPGLRAARELHVVEPLADAGLGKREIRMLAAAWSLPVADKPATPCLASRIAVGVPVSIGRLGLVERAEIAVRARLAEAGAVDASVRPADQLLEVDDRSEFVARDASPFGTLEAVEHPGRDALLDLATGAAMVDDLADVRVPRWVAGERPRDVAGLDVREGHPHELVDV